MPKSANKVAGPLIATLIRHTSVAVAPGICYGQSDVDVSADFASEALAVASRLAARRFDAVYASPLQRCRKLAHYCGYADARLDRRLMEMHFGDWEMQAWEAIDDPQLARWYADWIGIAPTHGESLQSLIARVERFIAELRASALTRVALFTHAGVIRACGVVLGHFAAADAFDFKVDYGDTFDFVIDRD